MSTALLRLEHVRKACGEETIISCVNLTIYKGETVCIIGPSGAGKSLLLRLINRLDDVTEGRIFLLGEEITAPDYDTVKLRQRIGMIFQSFNLFPHLTVIENIMAAPIDLKGLSRQEAYDLARKMLTKVGLLNKMFNYPEELSGGQMQRVAIIRALAMNPELLLLDEPTSALDIFTGGEVEAVIREVAQTGVTMIIVTHNLELAQRLANRIVYLDEGEVYEEGTPQEIFSTPKRERTRQFINNFKTLVILIDSPYFDFLECHSKIEAFSNRCEMSDRSANVLKLLFEEICCQMLLPRTTNPKIRWILKYSSEDKNFELSLDYNGEPFDIRNSENDLSWLIIRKKVEHVQYYQITQGNYTNSMRMTVKPPLTE